MPGRRSRVVGAASYRRLLKRLPEAATNQLRELLVAAGPKLIALMRSRLPTRTGKLNAALDAKVTPSTLTLKLGLLTKALGSRFFYGHILDVGRRAQTVTVTRLHRGARSTWANRIAAGSARARSKPADLSSTYQLRVKAMKGRFVESAGLRDFRTDVLPDFSALANRIVGEAAAGVGDD